MLRAVLSETHMPLLFEPKASSFFHLDFRLKISVFTKQQSIVALQFFNELLVFPVARLAETWPTSTICPTTAVILVSGVILQTIL